MIGFAGKDTDAVSVTKARRAAPHMKQLAAVE
jgi:hypothetical protein